MGRVPPVSRVAALTTALIFVIAGLSWASVRYPALEGRVVDQAGLLSPSARANLAQMLEAHERKTSNQVVVATIPSLDGMDIAEYGVGLGRAWTLGQAGRNNGAILLVAPKERLVRIEVGYGLEATLTDALSRTIIEREIVSRFRAGDMEGGIVAGATAMLAAIDGAYVAGPQESEDRFAPDQMGATLIVALFLFAVVIPMIERQRAMDAWRRGGMRGPRPETRWGTGSGGGFGGFSGGSLGGGFSGGGGSFGGGGATGRW